MAKDQPAERCSETEEKVEPTTCITSYIEREVGCTLPVQMADVENVPLCVNATMVHKFLELNRYYTNTDTKR